MTVARDYEGFVLDLLDKFNVNLTGGVAFEFTKTSRNIVTRTDKLLVEDFMSTSRFYRTPDYTKMRNTYVAWDEPIDRADVPTKIFTDERCLDRPLSVVTTMYNTLDDVGPRAV